MLHSTHYNLNLAEGTDLVNPLTVDVPNYQTIDSTMFANEQAGVGSATELKSGTIHAITRANANRNVFRFKSTSVFNTGDTFTVDGGTVTALYPDGSSLKDRCFIIGSDVLCLLDGSQLTVLATYYPEAKDVEYSAGVSVKDKIDSIESDISDLNNPTATTGTATLNASLDYASGAFIGWVKKGKLVFVTYSFTLNSQPTNTDTLFSGLPLPELITGAYNWVVFENQNGANERASLNADGSVSNAFGFFVRTGDHNGSFCYVAK